MNFLDNVKQNVVNSAKNVSNTIFNTSPEQRELAGLRVQLEGVVRILEAYYTQIGERYVDYVSTSPTDRFDVDDILEQIKTQGEIKAGIELKIQEKEEQIRAAEIERVKAKAQEEFDKEQAKLDHALKVDVITIDEYNEKLAVAQKKLDNFDVLRKLQLQYEMQIITKEEYQEKVKDILG